MGRRTSLDGSHARRLPAGKTSLVRSIQHYRAIVKTQTGNKAHYALGALEVLEKVKVFRDELREEMKDHWRGRAVPNVANLYYQKKEMVNSLDNLMEPDDV